MQTSWLLWLTGWKDEAMDKGVKKYMLFFFNGTEFSEGSTSLQTVQSEIQSQTDTSNLIKWSLIKICFESLKCLNQTDRCTAEGKPVKAEEELSVSQQKGGTVVKLLNRCWNIKMEIVMILIKIIIMSVKILQPNVRLRWNHLKGRSNSFNRIALWLKWSAFISKNLLMNWNSTEA